MIQPDLIIVTGVITALLCAIVGWRYRGQNVPVSSDMFVMMTLGAAGIALFYVGVKWGAGSLTEISRWLWIFILLSTATMAVSVLVMKRDKWHG